MLYFCNCYSQTIFCQFNRYSMKKNYFTSSKKLTETINQKAGYLFFFFAVLLASKQSFSQTYCPAAATSTSDDEIFNVTFGPLNNSSTCGTTGGTGSLLNMYSNYTNLTPQVFSIGSNYPLSVTVGQCGLSAYSGIVAAWIDFNQNGLFTDPGEEIYVSPYTLFPVAGISLSAPGGITIPFTATPGTTRMRIIADESSLAPGPCDSPTWGEVEDYNVTLLFPFPVDLTVTQLINPLSSKNCFGTDTIVARIQNYGSNIMDFSVTPAVLTVEVSGAATNTFTLGINTGTLGIFGAQNYTVTTNYNMSTVGTYSFKAYPTVAGDGSAANDTIYKTVNKIITPTPNLGNDTLFCSLPVILNSNATANSYLWNNGSIGSNLNITTPGKYWVRATNANGCSNSDTIQVGLGASPIVTLGPDTAFCQGSNLNLYAGAGSGNTYTWNTGATTSSISVNTSGTYSVLVTNTIGCQSSDIINISSKAKPSVSLVFTGLTTFCKDDNTVKVLTEGSPNGGTYIGAAVSTNTFSANQAGQGSHIILYTITGSNGCSNTAKDTLTVNACVGIEELTNDLNFNVYPNPTTGILTLDLTTTSDLKGVLYITSIDGKVVLNDVIEGNGLISKSINISDLENGIYYLKLETKDAIKTYKVLKQ